MRQILPDGSTVKKAISKQVMGFVGDVAGDVLQGESIGDALSSRAKERAADILRQGVKGLSGLANKAISKQLGKRAASALPQRPAKRQRLMTQRPVPQRKAVMRRPIKQQRRRLARRPPVMRRRFVSMQKYRRGLF